MIVGALVSSPSDTSNTESPAGAMTSESPGGGRSGTAPEYTTSPSRLSSGSSLAASASRVVEKSSTFSSARITRSTGGAAAPTRKTGTRREPGLGTTATSSRASASPMPSAPRSEEAMATRTKGARPDASGGRSTGITTACGLPGATVTRREASSASDPSTVAVTKSSTGWEPK